MLQACDVQLSFDQPDAVYAVGDEVTGKVCLTPHRTLDPSGMTVELFWRTHGRGNRTSGETIRHKLALTERRLEPGRTYSVPFGFTAPAGPLTYRGHLLNVDWYVRAVLDVPTMPNFLDPKAETELLLLPTGMPVSLGPDYKPPESGELPGRGIAWPLVLFGAVFSAVGLVVFLAFFGSLGSTAALFPLVFVLAGVFCIFLGVRNALATRRLGEVTLSLSRRELVPGDTLECDVGFVPTREVQLERLCFVLKAHERVVQGSGTNKTTHRHKVYEETRTSLTQRTLTLNEPVKVSEQFRIPLDAPYTFVANNNELVWSMDVLIDVQGVWDWHRDVPLTVCPWRETENALVG